MSKFNLPRLISIEVLALVLIVLVGSYFGYAIFKQTQAANLLVPEYDIDYQVAEADIETYNNINKDKYGDVDEIEAAKGELLVRLKDYVPLYEIASIAAKYDMDILERYRYDKPSYRLRFSSLRTPDQRLPENQPTIDLNQTPASTEPLTIQQLSDIQTNLTLEDIWQELDANPKIYCVALNFVFYSNGSNDYWGGGYLPNDPMLGYFVKEINAQNAWQKLYDLGLPPGGNPDVWTAVIDTGVDLDHPDLVDNIAHDASGNPVGRSFVPCNPAKYTPAQCAIAAEGGEIGGDGIDNNNDGDIDEKVGHGTKVAAHVAERGDNNIGNAGIGFTTGIVPINIANLNGDKSPFLASAVINSINYARSINNVRVINLSWGGYTHYQDVEDVINSAFNTGLGKVIVAAAGNDHIDTTYKRYYPSSYKNVISVTTGNPQEKAVEPNPFIWTNYGKWVDIHNFQSHQIAEYNDTYTTFGVNIYGATSFTTPAVSGTAALLFSRWPQLTAQDAKDIIIQRANTVYYPDANKTGGCGYTNAGFTVVSRAPIITSPVDEQGNPECISLFKLGEDITISWKPFPIGPKPDYYKIWYRLENGSFYMPGPDEGTAIGQTKSTVITSKFMESQWDGTHSWRVAAVYIHNKGADNEFREVRWTQAQTIKKHVGSEIFGAKSIPISNVVLSGCKIKWEKIPGANNYIARIQAKDNNAAWAYIAYNNPLGMEKPSYTFTHSDIEALQNAAGDDAIWEMSIVGTALGSHLTWAEDSHLMKIPVQKTVVWFDVSSWGDVLETEFCKQ